MLDAVEITLDGLIERVYILPQKRDHPSILNKVNRKINRNSVVVQMSIKISEHIQNGEILYKETIREIKRMMGGKPYYDCYNVENQISIGNLHSKFRAWARVSMDIFKEKCNKDELDELYYEYERVLFALSSDYNNDDTNREYDGPVLPLVINGFSALIGELKGIKESALVLNKSGNRVFIVHGRDDDLRDSVRDYVEAMELEPVVLKDEVNEGRVLFEKFIDESNDAGFAIILMTADDYGGLKGSNSSPRARQNVVFEYGYFVGKLGRKNVCVIMDSGVDCPTDLSGVVRIDSSDWKSDLRRELRNWNENRLI